MGIAYDETKTVFRIGRVLASGGQGVVSHLDGIETHCIKIYHERPTAIHAEKLKLLRSLAPKLSKVAALPSSVAFSDAALAAPIGIFIPFVSGNEIYELYGTRARLQYFPKANFKFLVHTAFNLALTFDELHSNRIVVGDVNEQNIKVLSDATVRLIDCDSFQIDSGATVYTSDVGTLIWTPPELQGKNLDGFQRNPNHDLFGLAQLIFLLLFAGRHPFSGVPKGPRQFLPDEAIREHAFAFAPPNFDSPLSPPPGCPSFNALPPNIQQSFLRAFLKGSEKNGARPSAREWKELLVQLVNSLAACTRQPGHVFWKGASSCPWCEVLHGTGVDIFPTPIAAFETNNSAIRDDVYLSRLGNLRPHPFNIQRPQALDLVPEPLPPAPSGLWNAIHKLFAPQNWKKSWLGGVLNTNRQMLYTTEGALRETLSKQQSIIAAYNNEFDQIRKSLQPLILLLTNSSNIRREIENKVESERRQIELNDFLEGFSVHRASIPDIKEGRKIILRSHNIETAADITTGKLYKVPGFGNKLKTNLWNWKRDCEAKFKFDATKPLSAHLRQESARRFQERIKQLKEEVAKCETKLNDASRRCIESLRPNQAQVVQVSRQRDQAKANITFLESQLKES